MPDIGFAQPGRLHLLIPLVVLIVAGFALKWALSRRFEEFFSGESVSVVGLSPARSWIKGSFLSLAFTSMVFASGGPFMGSRVRVPTFMAALDISQSMWCEDYAEEGTPLSRLETGKRNLLSLLDALPPESRFGVAVFAGRSDPLLILTHPQQVGRSKKDLRSMITGIRYSWTWEDGTDIKRALSWLVAAMEKNVRHYGTGLTLIVLTDGEEFSEFTTQEPALGPQSFASMHLVFAGIGTEAGAMVPEFDENWRFKQYREKYDGTPIVSRLDERNLTELARTLGGSYRRIKSGSDLNGLLQERPVESSEHESRVDVSWALWLGSFVLLVLSMMI